MLLILHKYVVTDLCVLTAVASGSAIRSAIRDVFYIEHLRVGATGTVFKSPPVILSGKIEYILRLKS